jgi:hypothetical protein
MNNTTFINNLKHKQSNQQNQLNQQQQSQSQLQSQSQSQNQQQQSQPNNINKYNPDVNNNYERIEKGREEKGKNYTYTNIIWKPIIGSINKDRINKEDLKIDIDKPNHIIINTKYEQEMMNRLVEQEQAKKLSEEYAKINNIYKNPIMDEIKKPINETFIEKIDTTFIELKQNSNNIDSNNIDHNNLLGSMDNLDELMKSIENL